MNDILGPGDEDNLHEFAHDVEGVETKYELDKVLFFDLKP